MTCKRQACLRFTRNTKSIFDDIDSEPEDVAALAPSVSEIVSLGLNVRLAAVRWLQLGNVQCDTGSRNLDRC